MKRSFHHLTAIGMRVYSNHRVYYTIIERQSDGELLYRDISYLNVPLALSDPERLNFVRNTMLDIMDEYRVTRAAIRVSEIGFGKFASKLTQLAAERLNLEGVLQESLASCSVEKFVAGRIVTLSAIADLPSTHFKKLASGEMKFEYFPEDQDWTELSLEARESTLTCFAALHL